MCPVGMKNQLYTVKQLAGLAGVGIKTLHHYHALGLLLPLEISEAGYRLYGRAEVERLQAILFYRELGFPLKTIRNLMSRAGDHLALLRGQRDLIRHRRADLERLLATLERSIAAAETGEDMPDKQLFEGFGTTEEWNATLADHNAHIKAEYAAELPAVSDAPAMNEAAAEATRFMRRMADALRQREKPGSTGVRSAIEQHLAFLDAHGHPTEPAAFVRQTQFFMDDDFHHDMLEGQQVGLSAFLNAAARAYAG